MVIEASPPTRPFFELIPARMGSSTTNQFPEATPPERKAMPPAARVEDGCHLACPEAIENSS
jgi:hypothetical protein